MSTPLTTIEVPPEVARILQSMQQQAQEQGVDLAQLLESLSLSSPAPKRELTPAEKAQALLDWAASHAPETPVILDDRREALYED